jgi:NAD(P)-dependent dehydrogenase (short-subunit alcohol dehydrogenase family)
MDTQLTGKRALVTGAASGMGKAIAEAFAGEGATVAVHARSIERAQETIDSITSAGGECLAVAADLMKASEIASMCADAIKGLGGIDIVVNNAGVYDYVSVPDMTEEQWDWIVGTDMKAPFLVTKHTLPTMLKQGNGGCLIYNASTNGKTADGLFSAYNAAKHGLIGFARCVAAEVGEHRINVNTICPGWVDTKMAVDFHTKWSKDNKLDYDEFWQEDMADTNMLHRIGEPRDIADFAVYLASERGRFIHGQAINVCGGLCYW